MGVKRVQQEDIIKMNELYIQIGTYAGVARAVGFSAGTVKRYIQENYVPQDKIKTIEKLEFEIPSISDLVYPKNWNEFLQLTDTELEGMKILQQSILL